MSMTCNSLLDPPGGRDKVYPLKPLPESGGDPPPDDLRRCTRFALRLNSTVPRSLPVSGVRQGWIFMSV